MDDQVCPRCKTTRYRNPNLKLLVNVCGHAICENCVDLLFIKGSAACPECKVPLRRNNYRTQLFEDSFVEKEVDIRRRILKDFNKQEEDFASLQEYNDYLEDIETIIFNLANDIDILCTNKKIEAYKKENREQIIKSKVKGSRQEEQLQELLEEEEEVKKIRQEQMMRKQSEDKKKKVKNKEALIDELMFSDIDAKQIVASHAKLIQKDTEENAVAKISLSEFSSGVKFGRQNQHTFLPVPKNDVGKIYAYKKPEIEVSGPLPPVTEVLLSRGYTKHIRVASGKDRAGGYIELFACLRAVQDAMSGLYCIPTSHRQMEEEAMDIS